MAEITGTVVERGSLAFVFRPKVEQEAVRRLADVERFHLVMQPDGRGLWRLIVLGRKRLPGVSAHETLWGFVDAVERDRAAVRAAFAARTYMTKTRGERHLAAGRAAGEAGYALVRSGGQLSLAYRLHRPETPGPAQRALRILPEASYALSIKNPEALGAPMLDEDRAAHLPRRVQARFRDRRFEGDDPAPLDYAGTEILLIGASKQAGEAPLEGHADALRLIGAKPGTPEAEPLLEGDWT